MLMYGAGVSQKVLAQLHGIRLRQCNAVVTVALSPPLLRLSKFCVRSEAVGEEIIFHDLVFSHYSDRRMAPSQKKMRTDRSRAPVDMLPKPDAAPRTLRASAGSQSNGRLVKNRPRCATGVLYVGVLQRARRYGREQISKFELLETKTALWREDDYLPGWLIWKNLSCEKSP